jgi:DNA invertase Pin-like site-specific DNA recombinase
MVQPPVMERAMPKAKRAALYLRVSTDSQTTDDQRIALERVAAQRGWTVSAIYDDNGVSGAKGRNQRAGDGQAVDGCEPWPLRCGHVLGTRQARPFHRVSHE